MDITSLKVALIMDSQRTVLTSTVKPSERKGKGASVYFHLHGECFPRTLASVTFRVLSYAIGTFLEIERKQKTRQKQNRKIFALGAVLL